MNTKSHTTKTIIHEKSSPFSAEKKETGVADTPLETMMSDLSKKLRYVSAQMQNKYPFRDSKLQHLVKKDDLKSYLDDISRAILADHYARHQREKKVFEHLEQIKVLIQNLQNEKKVVQDVPTPRPRPVLRSQAVDSVVHHLARMSCEEGKVNCSPQEVPNVLQKNIASTVKDVLDVSQRGDRSFLHQNTKVEFIKKGDKGGIGQEKYSGTQSSGGGHIKNDTYAFVFKNKFLKILFFLSHSVKKWLLYFLIVAFMAAITLCSYSFLEELIFF
ncbi:hypothetical protein [Bartonella sp. CB189]|uniref:hypothetical protein n=1 Tax=Bartonella sp. CB189 TaxID=3112254 RepID=UPI002F965232